MYNYKIPLTHTVHVYPSRIRSRLVCSEHRSSEYLSSICSSQKSKIATGCSNIARDTTADHWLRGNNRHQVATYWCLSHYWAVTIESVLHRSPSCSAIKCVVLFVGGFDLCTFTLCGCVSCAVVLWGAVVCCLRNCFSRLRVAVTFSCHLYQDQSNRRFTDSHSK